MNMRNSVLAAALVAAAAASGIAGAATMHVTTNASWEVSLDNGANFIAVTDIGDHTFSNGQTVDYLWSSVRIGGNESRIFRYSFNLAGAATGATLFSIQDDDILAFKINGNTVYSDNNGVATTQDPGSNVFAGAGLVAGLNTIEVNFLNTICCGAGLGVDLAIDFTPDRNVPVPGTLGLAALGLAAFGARRRRSA